MKHRLTEGESRYMDISKYNLVNASVSQDPRYVLPNEVVFDIYISPDQEVRNTYLRCMQECQSLCNPYMSEVR